MRVAVLGAMDTKGEELLYLSNRLRVVGVIPVVIDISTRKWNDCPEVDVTNAEVAAAAGGDIEQIQNSPDREMALDAMGRGAAKIVSDRFEKKEIFGAIALGGGQGTSVASRVMAILPVGAPKFLVSTIATVEHLQKPFQIMQDTVVVNSLVDINGLNSVLCTVLDEAAAAFAGMVKNYVQKPQNIMAPAKVRVGVSMWGVTTPCVNRIKNILEAQDIEVLTFHAVGRGGRMMEAMIEKGEIQGVADMTLAEITHPLLGGANEDCPGRLEAAGKTGIPQVVSLGSLDMINFVPGHIPEKYMDRKFHMHSPVIQSMRSNKSENVIFAKVIAEKLNMAKGPTQLVIPTKGLSANDREGGSLYDPDVDAVLFETIIHELNNDIVVTQLDYHINDPEFADYVSTALLKMMIKH